MGVAINGIGNGTGVAHLVGESPLTISTDPVRPLGAVDYVDARQPGTHMAGAIGAGPLRR